MVDRTASRQCESDSLDDVKAFLDQHVYQTGKSRTGLSRPVLYSLIEHVSIGAFESDLLRHVDLADLPGMFLVLS